MTLIRTRTNSSTRGCQGHPTQGCLLERLRMATAILASFESLTRLLITWLRACVLSKPLEFSSLYEALRYFLSTEISSKCRDFSFFQAKGVSIKRVLPPPNHRDLGQSHPSSLSLSFPICKDRTGGKGSWKSPLGEQSAS